MNIVKTYRDSGEQGMSQLQTKVEGLQLFSLGDDKCTLASQHVTVTVVTTFLVRTDGLLVRRPRTVSPKVSD